MRFSRWVVAGSALMVLAAGGALALGAGKAIVTPPAPITGDFTLTVSAAYTPVPPTPAATVHAAKVVKPPPATFLSGTGSALADATTNVTVTINPLTDTAATTTATVIINNPLTRNATWVNSFTGTGSAVVAVGGVDTPLTLTVQGQLVQGKFGTRVEGCFFTTPPAKGAPAAPQLRGEFEGYIPPPPPTPIYGTFTVNAGAAYIPAPSTTNAAKPFFGWGNPPTFLSGTGSGTADSTGVTATINPLTDKAATTTATITLNSPLAPSSTNNPNKFSGTGSAVVAVGGVDTTLTLTVQGHLEQGKNGPKIEGCFYTAPPVKGATPGAQMFGEFEGPVTLAP